MTELEEAQEHLLVCHRQLRAARVVRATVVRDVNFRSGEELLAARRVICALSWVWDAQERDDPSAFRLTPMQCPIRPGMTIIFPDGSKGRIVA